MEESKGKDEKLAVYEKELSTLKKQLDEVTELSKKEKVKINFDFS